MLNFGIFNFFSWFLKIIFTFVCVIITLSIFDCKTGQYNKSKIFYVKNTLNLKLTL